MPRATNRALTLVLLVWLPLHFAAQVAPPLQAAARRIGGAKELQPDAQRGLAFELHPALADYLGLFGVVQAYGFFADLRHHGFRFRVHAPEAGSEELTFPPATWTAFEYELLQLRLFELLAFSDEHARAYLGSRACERWPGAASVRIEKLAGTRARGEAELGFDPVDELTYSCSR